MDRASAFDPGAPKVHAVDDSQAIRKGFHPKFISGEVLDTLWRYTLTRAPYHVHLRNKPVKSRPKVDKESNHSRPIGCMIALSRSVRTAFADPHPLLAYQRAESQTGCIQIYSEL